MRDYFAEEIESKQVSQPRDYFAEEIEQAPPKRKANLMDLVGLAGTSSATQGGRLLSEQGSGMLGNIPKMIPQVKESLKPQNPSEGTTLAMANIAGFMSPQAPLNALGAKIATGVPQVLGGGKLAQGVGYGLAGATENALIVPENTEEYLQPKKIGERAMVGGALGVAIPSAIGAVSAGARMAGSEFSKLPSKLINELIGKTPKKARKYNINPSRTILDEGIVSNDVLNLDDLAERVTTKKQEIGQTLTDTYKNMQGIVDAQNDVLSPALKRMRELMEDPEQNKTAISKIRDFITDNSNKPLNNLTPEQAWELKKSISGRTKYSGGVGDDEMVNEVRQKVVRNLTKKLNEMNPDLKKLNMKYSDLNVAEEMISNSNANMQSRNIFSPSAKAGGGLVAGLDASVGGGFDLGSIALGLATASGIKAMQTPALKTRLAQTLNAQGVQKIAEVMKKSPTFKSAFNKIYGSKAKSPDEIISAIENFLKKGK